MAAMIKRAMPFFFELYAPNPLVEPWLPMSKRGVYLRTIRFDGSKRELESEMRDWRLNGFLTRKVKQPCPPMGS